MQPNISLPSIKTRRSEPGRGTESLGDLQEEDAIDAIDASDMALFQEFQTGRSYGKSVSISRTFKWGLGKDPDFDDFDPDDDDESRKKSPMFLKRRVFWRLFIPFMVTALFSMAGALFLEYNYNSWISLFETWRLCFFIAGIPILCWIGDFFSFLTVWFTEKSLFKVQNAYYYAYALRRPIKHLLRAALAMGWWAIIMEVIKSDEITDSEHDAIVFVLRLLGCITLFTFGNVLKKYFAKSMASNFNRETHLQKMHSLFEKEYLLHALLRPRSDISSSSEDESDDDSTMFGRLPFARSMSNAWRKRMGLGSKTERSDEGSLSGGNAHSFNPSASVKLSNYPSTLRSAMKDVRLEINIDSGDPEAGNNINAPIAHPPRNVSFRVADSSLSLHDDSIDRQESPTDSPTDSCFATTPSSGGMTASRRRKSSGRRSSSSRSSMSTTSSVRSLEQQTASRRALSAASARRISLGAKERGFAVNKMVKLEQFMSRNALKVTYKSELSRKYRTETIETEEDANRLSSYLFSNIRRSFGRKEISKEDLEVFLKVPSEVNAAFEMLDDNKDGTITAEDVNCAVHKIWVERTNLTASLHDTKAIVKRLGKLLGWMIHAIFCFAYLFIFHVNISSLYTAISALILGFSFIFSNSVRRLYENVVFLFVVHSFDIGDVLEVNDKRYIVEEISLNFTCFKAGDNRKWWYPNHILSTTPFINVTNSGCKEEYIRILVDFDTPIMPVLERMRAALAEMEKQNRMEFSETFCSFRESATPMKMTLYVGYAFSHPGTSIGRCNAARTKVFMAISQVLQEMKVGYTWPAFRPSSSSTAGANNLESDPGAVMTQAKNDANSSGWMP